MEVRYTMCALFYGDYLSLAQRCLGGLEAHLPAGRAHITDIRLGLNAVSPATLAYVETWAARQHAKYGLPVVIYIPERNVMKYPLMRRMFHDQISGLPLLADYVMWFDDDAFFDASFSWRKLERIVVNSTMVGKLYSWLIRGEQWKWVQSQSWYDPKVGSPPKRRGLPVFLFAQGSWWVLRKCVIVNYDWPFPELIHRGGDSTLGELLRQRQLILNNFDQGVHVNADAQGRDSRSPRRGYSGPCLGEKFQPGPLDLSHHDFKLTIRTEFA